MRLAGFLHARQKIGARPAAIGRRRRRQEALRLARIRAEPGRKAEEAFQRIVGFEAADAGRQRQVLRDVEAGIGEDRIVAVDAKLVGEPDRIRPAGDRDGIGDVADHLVVLQDVVRLPLVEQAGREAEAIARAATRPAIRGSAW